MKIVSFLSKCSKKYEIWTKISYFPSKCGKKYEIWMKKVWQCDFLELILPL